MRETLTDSPSIHAESSEPRDVEVIQELLVDQLRDILHAEKQVVKALPKMAKAAHSQQLQQLFEMHLEETEAQIERLNESSRCWRSAARQAMQGHDGPRRRGRRGHGRREEER